MKRTIRTRNIRMQIDLHRQVTVTDALYLRLLSPPRLSIYNAFNKGTIRQDLIYVYNLCSSCEETTYRNSHVSPVTSFSVAHLFVLVTLLGGPEKSIRRCNRAVILIQYKLIH